MPLSWLEMFITMLTISRQDTSHNAHCAVKAITFALWQTNNDNTNTNDNVYGAFIMARPLQQLKQPLPSVYAEPA